MHKVALLMTAADWQGNLWDLALPLACKADGKEAMLLPLRGSGTPLLWGMVICCRPSLL